MNACVAYHAFLNFLVTLSRSLCFLFVLMNASPFFFQEKKVTNIIELKNKHMKHNYADIELLPLHLWNNATVNPYQIIYHFYDYTSLDTCRLQLDKWFKAAFAEDYAWKDTPANLLYFYERFESLLYACWLLHNDNKIINAKNKTSTVWFQVSALSQHKAERIEAFKFLNAYELQNPIFVLHAFYDKTNFDAWRAELHNWLEAGLGKQTITHISNTENILPVMEQLNKLTEAAYLIHQAHLYDMISRKKKKRGKELQP
jgi:hypothetical protein